MIHKSFLGKAIFNKYVEKDEKVLYIAHQHGIVLVWDVLQVWLLGVMIPWYLIMANHTLLPLAVLIAFFFWVRFIYKAFLWFFDCWIFTDRGVIDVQWVSLFHRRTINVDYRHCEGITVHVRGFWQTIFRMGDMVLERDSDTNIMRLRNGADPHKVEDKFIEAKAEAHTAHGNTSKSAQIKELLAEMLQEYASNKGITLED